MEPTSNFTYSKKLAFAIKQQSNLKVVSILQSSESLKRMVDQNITVPRQNTHLTNPIKPQNDLKVVSILQSSESLKRMVDQHICFTVIPALSHLKCVQSDENLHSYENSFKMLLERKMPARSAAESAQMFRAYIPRLTSEIATRVFAILDRKLISADKYCDYFQKKFVFVYNALIVKDGCDLFPEEIKSIQLEAVSVAKTRLLKQWKAHKAIEEYVSGFLNPYKKGLIPQDDKEVLRRPPLIVGLEKFMQPLPYNLKYTETLARHHYLFECAEYILDQFEKETGLLPSFVKSKESEQYRIIFDRCIEAVLDAIKIDFSDMPMTKVEVVSYLDRFMKISDRMG